ncbi:MAG: MotA/TolQ/ExbB proton channel family protein [Treponema sp.]|jgi:biopolymer transport protein ExbB|nr:MotA/TolQ/ExbB proton channel family protein [Treponema sp.]
MDETTFSLLELFKLGGVFMWPLLVFSIATVSIVLERVIFLLTRNLRLSDMEDRVRQYIAEGDMEEAKAYLESQPSKRTGARILAVLVNRSGLSERRIEKAVETEALSCIGSLETGFNFLTALGSLAPLTGFLGTVSGMIGAFKSIAEATEVNAQIVANGIYEALVTTVFGLIIAIIAMIAHSLLTNVVDKFAGDVEKTCSNLITELTVRSGEPGREGKLP